MGSDLRLRQLTASDAVVLAELEIEVFGKDAWPLTLVREEILSPYSYYVGAEESEELLGYAGIRLLDDADVMTIGVVEPARRKGVGKALVTALLDRARGEGVSRVFLEVRESNLSAQKLYESFGFRGVGRVKSYYRNPLEDAVTMRLEL